MSTISLFYVQDLSIDAYTQAIMQQCNKLNSFWNKSNWTGLYRPLDIMLNTHAVTMVTQKCEKLGINEQILSLGLQSKLSN